jgi:hypothetical protein
MDDTSAIVLKLTFDDKILNPEVKQLLYCVYFLMVATIVYLCLQIIKTIVKAFVPTHHSDMFGYERIPQSLV